jgi:hypothetical protein
MNKGLAHPRPRGAALTNVTSGAHLAGVSRAPSYRMGGLIIAARPWPLREPLLDRRARLRLRLRGRQGVRRRSILDQSEGRSSGRELMVRPSCPRIACLLTGLTVGRS